MNPNLVESFQLYLEWNGVERRLWREGRGSRVNIRRMDPPNDFLSRRHCHIRLERREEITEEEEGRGGLP